LLAWVEFLVVAFTRCVALRCVAFRLFVCLLAWSFFHSFNSIQRLQSNPYLIHMIP